MELEWSEPGDSNRNKVREVRGNLSGTVKDSSFHPEMTTTGGFEQKGGHDLIWGGGAHSGYWVEHKPQGSRVEAGRQLGGDSLGESNAGLAT